jgi:hypothetical protein
MHTPVARRASQAACREPTNDSSPPASVIATVGGSHVIDVGSETATAPASSVPNDWSDVLGGPCRGARRG